MLRQTYQRPIPSYHATLNPATAAARWEDDQRYTPLVLLGVVLFALLSIITIPLEQWPGMFLYLAIVITLAILLYVKVVKPIDATFPGSFFALALLAKLIGSVLRLWSLTDVYNSQGDAITYFNQGQLLASYYRAFDFAVWEWYRHGGEGTTAMIKLVGFVYMFLPANLPGSFFLFAGLAFAGAVFFYRAVCTAGSDGSHHTYRWFIFFLPSILFWPSSLGKDAWIFFCSGLVALGWITFGRRGRLGGLVLVVIGLVLVNFIRPHTAAFLAIAIGFSFLISATRYVRSIFAWLIGAIAVVSLVAVLVSSGADFLQLEDLSLESVEDFYAEQQERTTSGSSRYETVNVFTPSGLVVGLTTALARPFPWEAHNLQALIASLETLVWLSFCWLWRKSFISKLRSLRSDPATSFALAYSLIMLLALTSIGNFGLIARQRVAVLPFWWMLFI